MAPVLLCDHNLLVLYFSCLFSSKDILGKSRLGIECFLTLLHLLILQGFFHYTPLEFFGVKGLLIVDFIFHVVTEPMHLVTHLAFKHETPDT